MNKSASFAPFLERFFIQRLMQQRQASPHTIISYRDTFRQFLRFAEQHLHKPPSGLCADPARASHSQQALHPHARQLPDSPGDRRTPCRARSMCLVRPT
ncbi:MULTISPECIES: site-specific integrase [Paraburkholderia]|uniref:site-specific integrase n=1 Tax=Paraburkholderia TaxID=1822464 RepID=UPI0031B9C7D3